MSVSTLPALARRVFAASTPNAGPIALHLIDGKRGLPGVVEYMGLRPLCDMGKTFCSAVAWLDPTEETVLVDVTDRERLRHVALSGLRQALPLFGPDDTAPVSDGAIESVAQAALWLPLAVAGKQLSLPETIERLTARAPMLGQFATALAMGRVREVPRSARLAHEVSFVVRQRISEEEEAQKAATATILKKHAAAVALEAQLRAAAAAASEVHDVVVSRGASKALQQAAYAEWSDLHTRHEDTRASTDAIREQCWADCAAGLQARRLELYGPPEAPAAPTPPSPASQPQEAA